MMTARWISPAFRPEFLLCRTCPETSISSDMENGLNRHPAKAFCQSSSASQLPEAVATTTGIICELPTLDERRSSSNSKPFIPAYSNLSAADYILSGVASPSVPPHRCKYRSVFPLGRTSLSASGATPRHCRWR